MRYARYGYYVQQSYTGERQLIAAAPMSATEQAREKAFDAASDYIENVSSQKDDAFYLWYYNQEGWECLAISQHGIYNEIEWSLVPVNGWQPKELEAYEKSIRDTIHLWTRAFQREHPSGQCISSTEAQTSPLHILCVNYSRFMKVFGYSDFVESFYRGTRYSEESFQEFRTTGWMRLIPLPYRAKAGALLLAELTNSMIPRKEAVETASNLFKVSVGDILSMKRVLRYMDKPELHLQQQDEILKIFKREISLSKGLDNLVENRIGLAKARRDRRRGRAKYQMLWQPRAAAKVTLSEDTGINKLGPIPISYVGTTEEETLESCVGCELLENRTCFAVYGTLMSLGLKKVTEKHELHPETTTFEYALSHRDPRAKAIRFGVLGDPSRFKIGEMERMVKMANELGLAVLGYTHHWWEPQVQIYKQYLLASCNNLEEADIAIDRGWVPAVILPWDFQGVTFTTPKGRLGVVCPAEYKEALTCNECRRCYPTHFSWQKPKVKGVPHYQALGFIDHSKKALIKRKTAHGKRLPVLHEGSRQKWVKLFGKTPGTFRKHRIRTRALVGTCLVDGCPEEVIFARGLCGYHFFRARKVVKDLGITQEDLIRSRLMAKPSDWFGGMHELRIVNVTTAKPVGRCASPGCQDQLIFRKGFCRYHYQQQYA